ncbi:MAG: pteridine reductase [Nitrosomonas sp.]|nr:pteridine reductase [Nitrosomonas sp.]MBK7364624.1 pteridine reductase [Nitrosomonas sp.]
MTSNNKVILITGGAKRVGSAICRQLHAQGANLVIHYRSSQEEAEVFRDSLEAIRPQSVLLIKADLLNVDQFPNLIEQIVLHFGQLDVLVNNASSFFSTPIGKFTDEAWHDLIGSNLKAPLFLSQAAAPYLIKQKGCIINIVDIHVDYPLKNHVIYNCAKGGLAALTRSLALELAPDIRVNGVSPGPILWPLTGDWANASVQQEIIDRTLLKRCGEPEDIAKAVNYLINDAPFVTGQIIAVDGGRSINL